MKRRKGGRGEEGEEVREKREGRGRGAEGGRSLKVLYHQGLSIHIPSLYPCLTLDLLAAQNWHSLETLAVYPS